MVLSVPKTSLESVVATIGPRPIVTTATAAVYHPSPQMKWWPAMVFVCVFVLCGRGAKNKLRAKKIDF